MKYSNGLICILSILLFSCQNKGTIIEEFPDRLFRPPVLEANVNGNEVTLSWIPIKNANYVLEISKDSMQFQSELQKIDVSKAHEYVLSDLWSQTRYSARIKAISIDGKFNESGYQEVTFITGMENIFYTVPPANITANSVRLIWDKTKTTSRIEVSQDNTVVKDVELPQSEIASGEKLIEGLNSGTTYTFKIFNQQMLRGTITAKTL